MNQIIDVTTLNHYAKAVLAADEGLSNLIICGEVTNFVRNQKSGHCYFSLRDQNASIKCVMFQKSARLLEFAPEDGMLVLAYGSVTIYERDGAFQLYVEYMRPYGVGAAQRAFDQLKEKLGKEGLFAPEHKKALPKVPTGLGVVTSATGAALQDIKNVLSRRWPSVKVFLAPVNVQGPEATQQIAAGIRMLDHSGMVDTIIVARGGGSREDLWVFNSETIARAAYACKTPLVSAVGHEIDYTILDYVADLRAPTPSAAAELCVPNREDLLQKIFIIQQNIQDSMQLRMKMCYNKLISVQPERLHEESMQKVALQAQYLANLQLGISQNVAELLAKSGEKLSVKASLAHSLSPYAVLARGYALVETPARTPIAPANLSAGDCITLHGNRVQADCTVNAVRHFEEENHEKRA